MMFYMILAFLTLLQKILYVILFICYIVGNTIIATGSFLFWGLYKIFCVFIIVTKILFEDFYLFLSDFYQNYNILTSYISAKCDSAITIIYNFLYNITYIHTICVSLFHIIRETLHRSLDNIIYLTCLFKQVIIAIGDGGWFGLMLLPNCIIYLLGITKQFLYESVSWTSNLGYTVKENCIQLCKDLYLYSSDIRCTTLTGWCALFLLVKYRLLVLRYLIYAVFSIVELYNSTASMIRNSRLARVRIFPRRIINQPPRIDTTLQRNLESYLNPRRRPRRATRLQRPPIQGRTLERTRLSDAQLCVICQDRQKCIVVFPCKHLCMCNDCTNSLQDYHVSECPICRCNISHVTNVYV